MTRCDNSPGVEDRHAIRPQIPETGAVPGFVVVDIGDESEPGENSQGFEANDDSVEPTVQFGASEPEVVTDAVTRARQLQSMFMTATREFGEKLETYVLHDSVDSDWSPAAATILNERFDEWTEGEELIVDCVSDMCMLDLYISFSDFHTKFVQRLRNPEVEYPQGFLPASFYFNEADGVIRIYFFRDSFDPALL